MRVLPMDFAQPIPATLARVADRRARAFWDPDQRISAAARAVIRPDRKGIVWDCVAVWKPGALWEHQLPAPEWQGRPVVEVKDELARALGTRLQ